MTLDSALKITASGAWNGGTPISNAYFENKGMFFKGGIPVNDETIQERIGVRSRIAAPADVRIGRIAMQNLLQENDIDPSRIKLLIGATNIGEDKNDPGPLAKQPFEMVQRDCPQAMVFDLYAGCPGFNISVELIFMLSLGGVLKAGDISVVVGAENIPRARTFRPDDTSNIIFGDDAMATALETEVSLKPVGTYTCSAQAKHDYTDNFAGDIAKLIFELNGPKGVDGIIVDNQLGMFLHRVPATAVRVQSALVEMLYPREAASGIFNNFKKAITFYDQKINAFAFDIMSLDQSPGMVETIARAYVESGRYQTVASVHLDAHKGIKVRIHRGVDFTFQKPQYGIIDTESRTHGCFASYIQAVPSNGEAYGEIDGKGVFLYAVRGAKAHLTDLLSRNGLTINDIELLFEHQANFAMIPMTLKQLLADSEPDLDQAVAEFLANKMVTNIHVRGNCSVVCMLRLPYALQHETLKEDAIQGYPINRNLKKLKTARVILYDSVGAGMIRSSFLQRIAPD